MEGSRWISGAHAGKCKDISYGSSRSSNKIIDSWHWVHSPVLDCRLSMCKALSLITSVITTANQRSLALDPSPPLCCPFPWDGSIFRKTSVIVTRWLSVALGHI
jgi:hypothetical protein